MQHFSMNPPDLRISTSSLRNICLTASLIALASLTWAARAESTATEPARLPVPILTNDENIQAELNSLNQFLDTNPQVEETLRANVDKATDAAFLKLNPAWDQHLKLRPETIRALRVENGFLLHRAMARMAGMPLLRDEVAQFDGFLDKNPAIRQQLYRSPRLIRDSSFLTANPALAEFLDAHVALSTAVLGGPVMAPGAKRGDRPSKQP
jgi:hypothetical protein